jgi:hypothetical protein
MIGIPLPIYVQVRAADDLSVRIPMGVAIDAEPHQTHSWGGKQRCDLVFGRVQDSLVRVDSELFCSILGNDGESLVALTCSRESDDLLQRLFQQANQLISLFLRERCLDITICLSSVSHICPFSYLSEMKCRKYHVMICLFYSALLATVCFGGGVLTGLS